MSSATVIDREQGWVGITGASPEAALTRDRVSLMGLPIDSFTPETLVSHLIAESCKGRGGYLMTPNLDHLHSVASSEQMKALAMDADIRVADGMPLVWASRLRGTPLPCRVAGSDLIRTLSVAAAKAGQTAFLVGGNPGAADAAAEILSGPATRLDVVGTYCPPEGFETDRAELERICAAVHRHDPDFVYVGLPFAKASELVRAVRPSLPSAWFLGLGVSFSFVSGDISRAPKWMQRVGLEWLHRLSQEPRRLLRRYLIEGLPFAVRLFGRCLLERGGATAVGNG